MNDMATAKKPPEPLSPAKQKAVNKVVRVLSGTIGSRIDDLNSLREKKRELEAKVKEIEGQYTEIEKELMDAMEAQGTSTGAGKHASASITVTVVGNITDRPTLEAFIKRTGNFQLFQARLSAPAVRELLEKKGSIPGVEPFHKKSLNLRTS